MPSGANASHSDAFDCRYNGQESRVHRNAKSRHAVVVHNALGPTPVDDWVLYPQEMVKHKNLNTKETRKQKYCSGVYTINEKAMSREMRPRLPPTPPENSPTKSERKAQLEASFRDNTGVPSQKTPKLTDGGAGAMNDDHRRMLLQAPFQRRLPTPDLSDIEGDDLWSCCAETEYWGDRGGASGNKLKMTLGLPVGAVMNCCDNSGARNLYIISVKGCGARLNRLPAAGVGDMVMATVKKGKPELRKKVMPAVVVRQSKPWRRADGVYLYFEDNAGVIVNPKGEMKGSAITGPVGKEAAEL
ncbi:MAG: hypothetical protein LQ342_003329 [Letrouitia transgressa]|nr:MAG: hypothetical protein LQ342_003329 [Letrouitia transgressa]